MSNPLAGGIALAAVMFSLAAGYAGAADREYCRDYAQTALRQVRGASRHPRCAALMVDAARWSPEFRDHFQWCLQVSKDTATDQRAARHRTLAACAR